MDETAARTRIITATTARDVSDLARAMVESLAGDFEPGELVGIAKDFRWISLILQDRAVLAERAAGTSWETIAERLHRPVDEVIATYADVYDLWVRTGQYPTIRPTLDGSARYTVERTGNFHDSAIALDDWRARHTEDWEPRTGRALAAIV